MNSQQMILYVLMIGYILYKQFQPREVRLDSKGKYILCIFGLYRFLQAIQNGRFQVTPLTVMGLVLTLVLLAGTTAYFRAQTCHIWVEGGILYKKGTWTSLLLWLVMIFLHGMADHLIPSLSSTFVLYLGISWMLQHWFLLERASKN